MSFPDDIQTGRDGEAYPISENNYNDKKSNSTLHPRVRDSIAAYATTGIMTDPLGMYTGYPNMTTKPELDEEGNLRLTIEDCYSAAEMPVQDVENQQYLKHRLTNSDDPKQPVQDADDL